MSAHTSPWKKQIRPSSGKLSDWDQRRNDALRRWSPLVEPQGGPVMPPRNIVMVIGTSDDVTPSDGGLALAEHWGVPTGNLFLRDQGHFSVGLGLERATAPLARLAEILGGRG